MAQAVREAFTYDLTTVRAPRTSARDQAQSPFPCDFCLYLNGSDTQLIAGPKQTTIVIINSYATVMTQDRTSNLIVYLVE